MVAVTAKGFALTALKVGVFPVPAAARPIEG